MITLHDFAPRGAGGPYTFSLATGQVLGLIDGDGEEARIFLEAVAGSVRHRGRVAVGARLRTPRDIAYAPDEPEQILFGRKGRDALRGVRAVEALGALEGEFLLERDFLQLSSGERRRLALAAVLGSGRRLLLFDRPTAGLDPAGQRQFWNALRSMGATAIVAALDEAEALRCDLVLALPGEGAPHAVSTPLPMALTRRAGWPPSPLAQVAAALHGEEGKDIHSLREEVEARCAQRHQE
ncbi:MAG: hypothetical protein M0Z66_04295 [Thermaerobacter sp.]|nr:hypothetical protein [Thermaerobacter sp.]